jgi:hypothetical protein
MRQTLKDPSHRGSLGQDRCFLLLKEFLPDKFLKRVSRNVADIRENKNAREELNKVIDTGTNGEPVSFYTFSKFLVEKVWSTESRFQTFQTFQTETEAAHTFRLLLF